MNKFKYVQEPCFPCKKPYNGSIDRARLRRFHMPECVREILELIWSDSDAWILMGVQFARRSITAQ